MLNEKRVEEIYQGMRMGQLNLAVASDEPAEPGEEGAPLDDAARSEREYVRGRLREELNREPTDEELDEWLRQQTEGY